jgi:hypothetical protein
MKSEIEKTEYFRLGKMTILCLITLKNGYEVIGTATKPMENLDQEEEARGIAYQRALYKLIELEAFPQPTASTAGWVPTIPTITF